MQLAIPAILLNTALGAGLGFAGGLLGIGGGLIAIPMLAWLYGMDQHLAQGTALVMIAPNVLIGFYRYHQKHRIDLRAVAAISVFSMIAAYVSGRLASGIDAALLRIAFALFLLALGLYFGLDLLRRRLAGKGAAASPSPPAPRAPRELSSASLPMLGIASGAMSGIFTIGGGLVVVPALVGLFRMEQTRAQGMALALVVPSSLIALFAYAQGQHVAWAIGLPMAVGGIASVSAGVALAHRFPPARLRLLFCAVLVGTAVTMLVEARPF
ncbi:sulfite exporter TauE/SafE family protein [Massilia haematophila]|uniref:Probable membrane transporter protein n=1 Tax=Massilia haematophila TaxID=457923 RepID=A0ABV7PD92_9BURK